MGEDQTDFTLVVIENPKPPRIMSLEPSNAIITEGEAIIFWCEVHGKPGESLHIKWFKRLSKEEMDDSVHLDDTTLFRSGSTLYRLLNVSHGGGANVGVYKSSLLIRNSRNEDAGTYVCLALNDKGYTFRNVTLTVVSTTVKNSSAHSSSYFFMNSTSFIVTALLAFGILLTVVVVVLFLYCCRKRSQKKTPTLPTVDMESLTSNAAPLHKPGKQSYSELSDIQSKSKLLCPEYICSFETESHFGKKLYQNNSFQ